MGANHKSFILFTAETLAVSLFTWQAIVLDSDAASKGPWGISLLILTGFFIAWGLILSCLIKICVSFLAARTQENKTTLRQKILLAFSPSLLLYLTFLQHFFFLNDIDPSLLALSCLGSIFLLAVLLAQLKREHPAGLATGKAWNFLTSDDIPTQQLARRLFFVSLLVYVIILSGIIFPAQPFTGDEPHYLLIAKSLISDGDINLSNNYQNKDYYEFYPGDLDAHAYPGRKGERFLYSKHFPALPVLLAPSFFLGEKLGRLAFRLSGDSGKARAITIFLPRLTLCFLTAFLGVIFFLFALELTQKKNIALLAWAVFSFTSPTLFYSYLIYPEIPIALILALISFRVIWKKNLSVLSLFGAGAGIGLLPWFGIKYIILGATIFFIVGALFLGSPGKTLKKAFAFALPFGTFTGLLICALYSMYGTLSPQTIYLGTKTAENISLSHFIVADLLDFFRRLAGYFFDQRIGIFVISPIYLLLLPGLFFLFKRFKKEASLLLGLFFVFFVFCSLNHYWGGYVPPARPLLPVLWILALFMAGGLAAGQSKSSLLVRNGILTLSFFVAVVSLRNPRLLYHESLSNLSPDSPREVFSNLLTQVSGALIDWRKLVPSLTNRFPEQLNWGPLIVWIPMILGLAALFLKSRKPEVAKPPGLPLSLHLGIVMVLSIFLITNAFFNIRLENGFSFENKNYDLFIQDENTFGKELGGFWVKGKKETLVVVKTDKPVSEIRLILASPEDGKTVVRLGRRTREVRRDAKDGIERAIAFPSPRGFPWKGGILYPLKIREENGFYPYKIDKNSNDARFLGVFVRIEVGPSSP